MHTGQPEASAAARRLPDPSICSQMLVRPQREMGRMPTSLKKEKSSRNPHNCDLSLSKRIDWANSGFQTFFPPPSRTFPLHKTLCRGSACNLSYTKAAQAGSRAPFPPTLSPLVTSPTQHLNPKATPGASQAQGSTAF